MIKNRGTHHIKAYGIPAVCALVKIGKFFSIIFGSVTAVEDYQTRITRYFTNPKKVSSYNLPFSAIFKDFGHMPSF